MPQYYTKTLLTMGVFSALTLAVPFTTGAQTTGTTEWNQGQAQLQKELVPGMAPETYRQKLEQLGYKVTATNYNNPDYLEYEVVKGDQSWEVQIDVDDEARKATEIDIAHNVWQTDATRAAIREEQQRMARTSTTGIGVATGMGTAAATNASETRRTMTMRNNQYSDRDRADTNELIRELEALPIGHDKEFYKNTLRQRGYEISRVNKDEADELELEAVKDGNSVQMEVEFDQNSGRSTEIDADTLWAESESTTRTREAQERRLDSSPTVDRRSRMNSDTDSVNRDTTTQNWERPRSGSTGTPTTPGAPSDPTSSGSDSGMDRRSQSDLNQ